MGGIRNIKSANLSKRNEDLALLASLSLLELLLAVLALGDGLVGDEPAGLGGVRVSRLATVPLSGELALLADAGAARGNDVVVLGGDGSHQQSADNEKLEKGERFRQSGMLAPGARGGLVEHLSRT